jgi:hypothetical protein
MLGRLPAMEHDARPLGEGLLAVQYIGVRGGQAVFQYLLQTGARAAREGASN